MAVVIMRDGVEHKISDQRYQKLVAEWESIKRKGLINLNGGGIMVSPSAIASMLDSEHYDAMAHEKKGDWQCKDNHWHPKFEVNCGIRAAEESKLSFIHDAPTGRVSKRSDRWIEAIRQNMQTLRKTGKYGTFTPDNLDVNAGQTA